MNGNLVRKPKKDENIVEEEEDIELDDDESPKKAEEEIVEIDNDDDDDDDDDDSSSGSKGSAQGDMKKRLLLLMGVIVAGTVILLIILGIASLFTHKNYSYEEMEDVLKEAAISYFADYPESLPQNDGDIVEVNVASLVYAGKMKDLSEYRTDGVVCTGSVQVEKTGSEYLYVPYLNCGNDYLTAEFYSKVLTDNPVTTSGEGLYSRNNQYTFRGENVNNYVQLDNSLWRIVKITSDNNVVLIHSAGLDSYQPWDDRYNEERLYESGINNYGVSRMKEYLEKIYSKPNKENNEVILSDKDKARIVSYTLCVGSRDVTSESKNNTEECRQKIKNQKLGLLTLSDYLNASLDTSCKSAETKSCMNYNYLAIDKEWWLATPSTADTSSVFKVDRNGVVVADTAASYSSVRPVIYLNSHIMYKGGKGTLDKPYTVK